MGVIQQQILLPAFTRGFHLVTDHIASTLQEIGKKETIKSGVLHVFIQHTSASLCLNENADKTVRKDFESHFNQMVPENMPYYLHTYEGPDDMPAHIKAALLGSSVTIPVTNGRLNLGIWQGVYLCEHRNQGGNRTLVLTLTY